MAGAHATLRFLGLMDTRPPARPVRCATRSPRARRDRPHPLRWLGFAEAHVRLEGHPRIRERALATHHRRRRRDHLVSVSLAVLLALGLLSIGAVRSPLLAVEAVRVLGVDPDQQQAIAAALDVGSGTNVLDVDLSAVEAQVEALPWVHMATATRRLPSTLEVRVVDREAVAAADFAGTTYLLDAEGVVLEQTSSESLSLARRAGDQALPRIDVALAPVVGRPIGDPAALASAAVAGAMPPALDAWIVAYRTSPQGEVDATLRVPTDTGTAELVAHLGRPEGIPAKAATIAALVEETVGRGASPAALDVRIPDRPVVRG